MSPQRIRNISTLGGGILIGTALIVIIPEGVDNLYSVSLGEEDTGLIGTTKLIGITLISGFVLMYLVDKLPDLVSSKKVPAFMSVAVDMSNLRFSRLSNNEGSEIPSTIHQQIEREEYNGSSNSSRSKAWSMTTGLVIHSLADGIALGASVCTDSTAIEAIVFLAIMIHKMPAAFGLTSILLREGLALSQVKKSLAVFAFSAPFGALAAYMILKILGANDANLIQTWTGLLLLLSGGTFLFVAVHAMNEHSIAKGDGEDHHKSDGGDMVLSVVGMTVPLLTLLVPEA